MMDKNTIIKMKSYTESNVNNIQKQVLPVFNTGNIFNTDKFRYDGAWYSHNMSDDRIEDRYAVIQVDKMPYISLDKRESRGCFISSIPGLIQRNEIIPFILFINGRFISWDDIDVIHNFNKDYLRVYHANYYHTGTVDMLILPFNVTSISTEDDTKFGKYMTLLSEYLLNNAYINNSNDLIITIPDYDAVYKSYPIGEWYYNQLKLDRCGLLSSKRKDQLSSISLVKTKEDENGNVIKLFDTYVNLLDKDSYDVSIVKKLCANIRYAINDKGEIICDNILFRFNSKGVLDDKGENIFTYVNDSLEFTRTHINSNILITDYPNANTNFNMDNYVIFKNGVLTRDADVSMSKCTVVKIDVTNTNDRNSKGKKFKKTTDNYIDLYTFHNKDVNNIYDLALLFPNRKYVRDNIKLTFETGKDSTGYIKSFPAALDYDFSDKVTFMQNITNGNTAILNYDTGIISNDLYAPQVKTACFTGEQINSFLKLVTKTYEDASTESYYEWTIVNAGYEHKESYPLIFKNGLLIEEYHTLTVYEGVFTVRFETDTPFKKDDVIEIMYCVDCNTDEIKIVHNSKTYPAVLENMYKIIPKKNIKIFIDDAEDLLIYSKVKPSEQISFPVYEKDVDGNFVLSSNVICGKHITMINNYGITNYVYDDDDNLVKYTDYNGYVQEFTYDANHNITRNKDNSNLDYTYEYDSKGRLIKTSNGDLYEYDSNDDLIHVIKSGKEEWYAYNNKHQIMSYKNSYGIIRDYSYNDKKEDILCMITGSLMKIYIHKTFDANGNIIELIESIDGASQQVQLDHLKDNKVTRNVKTLIEDAIGHTISNDTYTLIIASSIGGSSNDATIIRHYKYEYDGNDHVICMHDLIKQTDDYYYYDEDSETEMKRVNKFGDTIFWHKRYYNANRDCTYYIDSDGYWERFYYKYGRELVFVAKNKFAYERLYVERKAYKIKIDGTKFRYCDNQKQYCLFINGRKIRYDNFLITIPRTTRPFDAMYVYTAVFVNPEDRIELFYLPFEVDDDKYTAHSNSYGEINAIPEDGYVVVNRDALDVPMNNDNYIFFVNGKKIPNKDICNIDTNTIRFKNDIKYRGNLSIVSVNADISYEIKNFINNNPSKWDVLIEYIVSLKGFSELNNLFGEYTKMTTSELNMITNAGRERASVVQVGTIAIANEIVRDFWVSNGYDYNFGTNHNSTFIYDYYNDCYINKYGDTNEMPIDNGTLLIPAMDATAGEINIMKYTLYHVMVAVVRDKNTVYGRDVALEFGDAMYDPTIIWEYNDNYNTEDVISQRVNSKTIDKDDRQYTIKGVFDMNTTNTTYTIYGNDGYDECSSTINIRFYNGIYYGLIDEDKIDIRDSGAEYRANPAKIMTDYQKLGLTKIITDTTKTSVNYTMINNRYFIFACPTRLAKKDGKLNMLFILDNIDDFKSKNGEALYLTDGTYDNENTTDPFLGNLKKLKKYKIEEFAEVDFTNKFGYTEKYTIFKTNGFFVNIKTDLSFDFYVS